MVELFGDVANRGDDMETRWEIATELPTDERSIAEWDALLERQDLPSVFLSHEWISAWWKSFGAKDSYGIRIVPFANGAEETTLPWNGLGVLSVNYSDIKSGRFLWQDPQVQENG